MSHTRFRKDAVKDLVFRSALALALLFVACDLLPTNEFEPTGTEFNINSNIEVISLTGDPDTSLLGPTTAAIKVVSRTSSVESDILPAGLLLRRRSSATQHLLFLKDHRIAAQTSVTKTKLGTFCCNKLRAIPDIDDTFDFGPTTDNAELQRIVSLVRDKDISHPLDAFMVQRAVQMVTDSTGLTQAYVDSINALPPDTTD
jgi:hypothetical protein